MPWGPGRLHKCLKPPGLLATVVMSWRGHALLKGIHVIKPKTARRSNQSILKEINPEYSLEGLMLKLKFQCFGHLMQRVNSLEKTLNLGKTEGKRRRE